LEEESFAYEQREECRRMRTREREKGGIYRVERVEISSIDGLRGFVQKLLEVVRSIPKLSSVENPYPSIHECSLAKLVQTREKAHLFLPLLLSNQFFLSLDQSLIILLTLYLIHPTLFFDPLD